MDINQLKEKYTEITGKKPFGGWKAQELEERIDKFMKENIVIAKEETTDEEQARIEEANRINSMQYKTIPDIAVPVFIEDKPYIIINGKHVPYYEGMVIIKEKQLKKLELEIEILTIKAKKESKNYK